MDEHVIDSWAGVMAPLEPEGGVKYSWFQTTFDIPSSWKEDNVVINFGAVDWEATVFVNVSLVFLCI